MGHASLSSTQVYLGIETKDLDRMIEQNHPRERERRAAIITREMRKRPVARASTKPRKQALDEALDYVRRERANVVYREAKTKKPYAVLVPVDDEETIEAIEDVIDARAVERALAEMKRKGEKPIPYEQARKELGLK